MLTILLIAVAFVATPRPRWKTGPASVGRTAPGLSDTKGLPVEFGPALNVIWKAELPQGYSSPVIAGDRIFLTGFRNDKLLTLCVDRKTGKVIWEREAPRDRTEKIDPRNHPASPSAATDGQSVFVFFGDYGLIAYDVSGKELWRQPLGPFNNIYGMGASPIVVDDKVVLACDQSTGSFIAAFDKKTGTRTMAHARPEAKSGHSTPIVYTTCSGRDAQILLPGSFLLTAYAAESGSTRVVGRGVVFRNEIGPRSSKGTRSTSTGSDRARTSRADRVTVAPSSEVFAAQDANKDGKLSTAELPNKHAQDVAGVRGPR